MTADLLTRIMRTTGVSHEDAIKVRDMVAEETMQRYLDAHPTDSTIGTVGPDDQLTTAVRHVSAAVGSHYRTMVEAGMSGKQATKLARDMQEQWLSGVLPVSDLVSELMRGEDG